MQVENTMSALRRNYKNNGQVIKLYSSNFDQSIAIMISILDTRAQSQTDPVIVSLREEKEARGVTKRRKGNALVNEQVQYSSNSAFRGLATQINKRGIAPGVTDSIFKQLHNNRRGDCATSGYCSNQSQASNNHKEMRQHATSN